MRLGDNRISKLFIENQEIGDEERNGRQQEREKRLWTVHGEKEKEEERKRNRSCTCICLWKNTIECLLTGKGQRLMAMR